MPASQSTTQFDETKFYAESDTAPPLDKCLRDNEGNPINLTDASVTINIAYARWSHYYSPYKRIVDRSPCVVDPDQEANPGCVKWFPGEGDLTPTGDFQYTFEITFSDDSLQTVPSRTYFVLVIRATVGGTRGRNVP